MDYRRTRKPNLTHRFILFQPRELWCSTRVPAGGAAIAFVPSPEKAHSSDAHSQSPQYALFPIGLFLEMVGGYAVLVAYWRGTGRMDSWTRIQILIDKAKNGAQGAFSKVFESYSPRVEAFIQLHLGRRLRRKIEVEEILAETFLRASRSIWQFHGRDEKSLVRWLCAIAEHVILDEARRAGAAARESVAFPDYLKAQGPSPSQVAQRNERFERLKQSLKTLKEDYSKVIVLARLRGLPMKEVARRMGRSPEATSQLLYRALLKLREVFGNTDSLHLPRDQDLQEEGVGE